jgi:DNA-binding NtrC family response regulator
MRIDLVLELSREEALRAFEQAYFRRLMVLTNGNVVAIAKHAGIQREAVTRKIKKLNLLGELTLARQRKLNI